MTSPWDDKQKPNEKSPQDGKKDKDHGPHEHGLGGKKPDKETKAPKLAEMLASAAPELVATSETPDPLASVFDFPAYYYIPYPPPVRDQGQTPQCVAYSDAYDQTHMDRPEGGKWYDFDEARFFGQIGGGPDGAYLGDALVRRRDFGYPVTGQNGAAQFHRIAAFYQVSHLINAIKAAIVALPTNGGVLTIGPWYHSWFHPFASGKLPAPDYEVGGHATWLRGWNDNYGFRIRNSWGTDWGVGGDCFLPYAFVARWWEIWRTKDR